MLSYADLLTFSIFSIVSLFILLLMETHRANKLVDRIDKLETEKVK